MTWIVVVVLGVIVLGVGTTVFLRRGEGLSDPASHRTVARFSIAELPRVRLREDESDAGQDVDDELGADGLLLAASLRRHLEQETGERIGPPSFAQPNWEINWYGKESLTCIQLRRDEQAWVLQLIQLSGAPALPSAVQVAHRVLVRISDRGPLWFRREAAMRGDFTQGRNTPTET